MTMTDFDYIAEKYDDTRPPLPSKTLLKLLECLSDSGSLLEIGVGTGRIAIPLQENGIDVTGIDVSENMLEIARKKGLKKHMIADARALPFGDASFDSVLFVHVFHLLDDVKAVMAQARRVARKHVMTVFTTRTVNSESGNSIRTEMSKIYMELRSKYGYPIKIDSSRGRAYNSEMRIVEEFSPTRIIEAGEITSSISKESSINRFLSSSGYIRRTRDLPDNIRKGIESDFREMASKVEFPEYSRISKEYIAIWDL